MNDPMNGSDRDPFKIYVPLVALDPFKIYVPLIAFVPMNGVQDLRPLERRSRTLTP